MDHKLFLQIIIVMVSSAFAYQCDIKTSYRKEESVKCTSRVTIGKMQRTKCTVACTLENNALCLASNHTEDMYCELCLACPNYQQTNTIWSDIYEVNALKMIDFENSLKKALIVHVPMDSIVNGKVPATGTIANVVNGTSYLTVQPGKYGGAIFFPNMDFSAGNALDLGRHENDCMGQLSASSPLCQRGFTVSFWF